MAVKPRALGSTIPQSEDPRRDFITAVENNQPNLALYYAVHLLDEMSARIEELESNSNTSSTTKKTSTRRSSSKSSAKSSDTDASED